MVLKRMQPAVIVIDAYILSKLPWEEPTATTALMESNQLMSNIQTAPNVRMELKRHWTEPTACYVSMALKSLIRTGPIVVCVRMEQQNRMLLCQTVQNVWLINNTRRLVVAILVLMEVLSLAPPPVRTA